MGGMGGGGTEISGATFLLYLCYDCHTFKQQIEDKLYHDIVSLKVIILDEKRSLLYGAHHTGELSCSSVLVAQAVATSWGLCVVQQWPPDGISISS